MIVFPTGDSACIDILIYVEDPGAANYCADLPEALERRGLRTRLIAQGFALPFLRSRGAPVEEICQPITARDVLDQVHPSLVVAGTSENTKTFAFELIAEARCRGLKSVGVVDASGNAEYRFRGRTDKPLHHAPEWLAVPDAWTKEAYVALGYPQERIAVCGHPHYDHVLHKASELYAENRQKQRRGLFHHEREDTPVWVFGAEISRGINHKCHRLPEYTLAGRGGRDGRTDIVLEEFIDAVGLLKRRPYLVLRLHPKNTREELSPYFSAFDQVSKSEPNLELIHAADLVVGMTSMFLVEAAIMGRPTLSIVPRVAETKSLPTIRAGITPCVTTREELRSVLPQLLRKGVQPASVAAPSFVAPGSLDRTASFLESLFRDPIHR